MDNKELELKIGVIGKQGVGKSTITMRFIDERFIEDYDPILIDEYRKKKDFNDKKIILSILDTASSEETIYNIRSWAKYCDSFVLVYSIDDKNTFNEILTYDQIIQNVKSKNYPKVLIGNKNDLFTKRVVKTKEGKELAKHLNCKYIETSAKNGENIKQLFYESALVLLENEDYLKRKEKEKEKEKKKGGCLLM
ncbi:ras gtpase [Anaeramoeba ignava]|uniref:Ras gtpase n=1 Tax=Anaeramoeba ignava TaxID=1746090 RepID=A0A9Q0LEY1_ANAIG|nr:ras gtpase [Anaeramoeba ignava]